MADSDEEEFYAAWRSMPVRRLTPLVEIDWERLAGSDVGVFLRAKLVEAPAKYAHLLFVSLEMCPHCGIAALDQNDAAVVGIYPEFTLFPPVGFGAIAHRICIDACPIVEGPTPTPW